MSRDDQEQRRVMYDGPAARLYAATGTIIAEGRTKAGAKVYRVAWDHGNTTNVRPKHTIPTIY